jgi:hypothetical protein
MAELGFFVELTCLHILLSTVKVSVVMDVIHRVGYKKCLLTTDAFFDWTPPAPEMLRLWIGLLLYHGLPSELIRVMVYNNPRDLLT